MTVVLDDLLENFDWIMEDYLFEFFCHVAVIPVTLLCFSLITYFKLKLTIL